MVVIIANLSRRPNRSHNRDDGGGGDGGCDGGGGGGDDDDDGGGGSGGVGGGGGGGGNDDGGGSDDSGGGGGGGIAGDIRDDLVGSIVYHLHAKFGYDRNGRQLQFREVATQEEDVITKQGMIADFSFPICNDCWIHISDKQKVPEFALKNGYDFGNPEALGLKMNLNVAENAMLAKVRIFQQVVKYVIPKTSPVNVEVQAMKGHVISFPHDGCARETIRIFPNLDVQKIVRVMFVGPQGKIDVIKRGHPGLTEAIAINGESIYNHARAILKVNNIFMIDFSFQFVSFFFIFKLYICFSINKIIVQSNTI